MTAVSGRPLLVFSLLSLALLLDSIAVSAIPPLLPAYLKPLHCSDDTGGFLLGVKALATLACILPSGLLVARLGHRPVLTVGLLAVVFGGVLLSLPAPKMWVLFLAMCLLGVSAQVSFGAAMVMATRIFGEKVSSARASRTTNEGVRESPLLTNIQPDNPQAIEGVKDTLDLGNWGGSAAYISREDPAEELSEAKSTASDNASLTQAVGILLGTESLGCVVGPFLLPFLYSYGGQWLPFSAISGLILVLLVPLLLLREEEDSQGGDWKAAGARQGGIHTPLLTEEDGASEGGVNEAAKSKVEDSSDQGVGGLWQACKLAACSPPAITSLVIIFSESFATAIVDTLVPIHLTACDKSLTEIGLFFGASALAYVGVSTFGLGIMTTKLGGLNTMLLGSTLLGVAQWVLPLRGACQWQEQVLALIGVGLGMSLMGGPAFVQLTETLGKSTTAVDEAFSVMLYHTTYMVAASLGPFLGPLLARSTSYAFTLQFSGGMLFVCIPVVISINRCCRHEGLQMQTSHYSELA